MKLAFKTFTQEITLLILFTFAIVSCERIDTNIVENWKLTETSYLITADQDFTFYNPFSKSWQGTILIDGEEFDASSFNYYYDNSWPTNVFGFGNVIFTFSGPKLVLYLYDERYILEPYEFDIETGVFKAEGMATSNNKSIQVKVNAAMPKIPIKKGEQIVLKDVYLSNPFTTLNLKKSGKLQTDYLIGDIMEKLYGKWSVQNNNITLSPESRESKTYQYNLLGYSLYLFKENIAGDAVPSNLSPFYNKLSSVTYQAVYKTY